MIEAFPKLSNSALLMLHGGVRDALAVDDNLASGVEKVYGVRATQDWRTWSNALETELDKRPVNYEEIKW